MGPFRFVPLMECRHSVLSMSHSLSGSLRLNGKSVCFNGGVGYIEGDRGHSFPRRYIWTQCNWREESPCSLMLSAADIPFAAGTSAGIIGVVS
jgi:hypothetical protein